ncbi:MAG: DUF6297 family protein [Propioniciclava sp.]|uniref:DUF6297 family protein n=1 Tax=Propioniciclava sp. TaxID=2038686 RepID=UPI0039E32E4D
MDSAEWTAADLRSWLRERRERPRTGWMDWYYRLFAVLLVVAMGASLARGVRLPLLACPPGFGSCLTAVTVFPLVWSAATVLVTAAAASLAGPISVTTAAASFVLALPLDRGDLLAPRLDRVLAGGVIGGLLSGLVLWLVVAPSPAWIAVCACAGALAVLSAVVAQQGGWRRQWIGVAVGVVVLAVVAALMLTGVGTPTVLASALALVAGVAAWWLRGRARAGLGCLSRFVLADRARLHAGLAGAASGADAGLLLDIATVRLAGTGTRRRLSAGGAGGRALAGYEVRRLVLRSPRLLVGVAAVMVTTLALPVHPTLVLALVCLTLVPALGLALSNLRTLIRAPGLARALGLSRLVRNLAGSAGAALAASVWCGVAVALLMMTGTPLGSAFLLAWAVGTAGLAGALRWIATPPPDFTTGLVMTDLGPVPVGALQNVLTGFTAPMIIVASIALEVPVALSAAVATAILVHAITSASR